MFQKKASFILVNWNGKETIQDCLDSIFAQTYRIFEIILVDNHSTDGSLEWVKKNTPIQKIIALDKNYGYAEANNRGLKHAEGEYIALVNNDAVLEKHWLEKAVEAIQSPNPSNIGSVATKNIFYHQRDTTDTAGVEFLGLGAGWDYKGLPENSPEVNTRKEVFGACATAALYKRELIEEVGLFDPLYFIYFEDTELAFKLRLFGYTCLYEPEAVCYHYGGVKKEKSNPFYIDYGRRNIEFLFFKNMQGYLLIKYLGMHLVYEFLLFVFFTLTGKGISFLKAKIDFLKNLGHVWKERKKLKKALITKNKYKDIYKVEQSFLSSKRSLWDKVKKAVGTYRSYMNLS